MWPKNEKISCHFQAKCRYFLQKINKQDSWFFRFWSLWPKNEKQKMEWSGQYSQFTPVWNCQILPNTKKVMDTGKSVSEALILESVNQQYDERLFIEFQEKYKLTTCCVQKLFFCFYFDIQNNISTQRVLYLHFSCNSMNNLSSYCWLTDSRMRASDTDLPVPTNQKSMNSYKENFLWFLKEIGYFAMCNAQILLYKTDWTMAVISKFCLKITRHSCPFQINKHLTQSLFFSKAL